MTKGPPSDVQENVLENPAIATDPPDYKVSIVAALIRFRSELKFWHWLWAGIVLMVSFSLNLNITWP